MTHFKEFCAEHGTVLAQCRCPGPKQKIIKPCPGPPACPEQPDEPDAPEQFDGPAVLETAEYIAQGRYDDMHNDGPGAGGSMGG